MSERVSRYLIAAVLMVALLMSCAGKKGQPPDRDIDQPVISNHVEVACPFDGRVQVIAYNVERGFFWEDVVEYVREKRSGLPATVLLLSECDRDHSRTGGVRGRRDGKGAADEHGLCHRVCRVQR